MMNWSQQDIWSSWKVFQTRQERQNIWRIQTGDHILNLHLRRTSKTCQLRSSREWFIFDWSLFGCLLWIYPLEGWGFDHIWWWTLKLWRSFQKRFKALAWFLGSKALWLHFHQQGTNQGIWILPEVESTKMGSFQCTWLQV